MNVLSPAHLSPVRLARMSTEIVRLKAELERLRAGLRMLVTQEYDAGYSPEGYAEAVLSGHEPEDSR